MVVFPRTIGLLLGCLVLAAKETAATSDESVARVGDSSTLGVSSEIRSLQNNQDEEYLCRLKKKLGGESQKQVYTVAVLAKNGPEAAWEQFNSTIEYLSVTAGQQFDPPIRFEMVPTFETMFTDVEKKLVDFVWVNPGQFSCIESEFEAYSLASQVSRRVVGGEVYDLKKFGGVIMARADNDKVNTIYDLKDKVIAAASITGLGSGQMQFLEMKNAGMEYLNDPKQLVFTRNQGKIVNGVLNGDFDVGFVRTDQMERTKDADGNLIDISLLKVIDAKPSLNIDGVPFPFESSTALYPEFNLAALSHVPDDVSAEVQRALLAISDHAEVGTRWLDCLDQYNETYCQEQPFPAYFTSSGQAIEAPCETTPETASLATTAMTKGKYSAFKPTLSYMQLRSMQQATGFIQQNENGGWSCTRASTLRDSVTCPAGQLLKSPAEFASSCIDQGLECDDDYQCICEPCYNPSTECINGVEIGDGCVPFSIFLPAVLIPIALISFGIFWFIIRKKSQELAKQKELAAQHNELVASLFPKQIRDRLMHVEEGLAGNLAKNPGHLLKTFLSGNDQSIDKHAQPLADLFPNCTVFFADIVGFTAWSSTREPAQVFVLLQTVYQAFDIIAKRRHVFKVETIGDSYVAVTGLPEAQPNHAIIMARFAWNCLTKVRELMRELEVQLGPGTGELGMRFGLHSGPVTAGVLRGDRARFQLFGDTVNTASRIESAGERNRIHLSKATADLLIDAGYTDWPIPREDVVEVKGKGALTTFWLKPMDDLDKSEYHEVEQLNFRDKLNKRTQSASGLVNLKTERLIDWMAELLLEHVTKIVAARKLTKSVLQKSSRGIAYEAPAGVICLDEVKEVMTMPKFNRQAAALAVGNAPSDVLIPPKIASDFRDYIELIARSYNDNPFHNFDHACHVTMSVSKLIKRIVVPDFSSDQWEEATRNDGTNKDLASHLHDFSHGIVSDPMTVFAIVFSALIHDVDHRGISNAQLCKEDPDMGTKYREKSVAEQNSLDLAWEALMLDQFHDLRQFIFGTQEEFLRFRQLIVNVVLATDIFDKELNDLRKMRWARAFAQQESSELLADHSGASVKDFRATVVMEHIIQASDVSHTMQHWHIYRKWNARLFREMYLAYKAGRMGADPSTFWYKGELSFFDNYVIPLAKKLEECNVFGVSSHEYLNYAQMNRAEWEERGEELMKELMQEVEVASGDKDIADDLTKGTSSSTSDSSTEAQKQRRDSITVSSAQ